MVSSLLALNLYQIVLLRLRLLLLLLLLPLHHQLFSVLIVRDSLFHNLQEIAALRFRLPMMFAELLVQELVVEVVVVLSVFDYLQEHH